MKRNLMKVLIPLALVGALAGVLPVIPALAAPRATGLHTVQGIVVAPPPSGNLFTIQSANNTITTVSVNVTTKYYLVPMGRVQNYVNGQVNKDIRQDVGKETRAGAMKELHIPANWRNDLGWLDTFDKAASFSNIALDDRIIARVDNSNIAVQVLIIQGPVVCQVRGNVTVTASPTIPPSGTVIVTPINTVNPQPVSLTWGANTEFITKGTVSALVTGQYGVVTYNSSNMTALLVNLAAKAPTKP